jgi:hypothetical protein
MPLRTLLPVVLTISGLFSFHTAELQAAVDDSTGETCATHVGPDLWTGEGPPTASFRTAVAAHIPSAGPDNLSAVDDIAGRNTIDALTAAGDRPSFNTALRKLRKVEFKCHMLTFERGDHQGFDQVHPAKSAGDGFEMAEVSK